MVGSNIGNILLVLGLAAALAPITVEPKAFRRDGTVMLIATGLCLAAVMTGDIGHVAGAALVVALPIYLSVTLWTEMRGHPTPAAFVYAAEAEAVPGPD